MALFLGFSATLSPRIGSLAYSSTSISSVQTRPVNLRMTRTVTYATASKPLKGIMKPQLVSPVLQEFVGAPEIARTQALKAIWAYIKENNLQDPEDKKIIVCDEKLKAILGGKERVGILEVSKLMSPHFIKKS